jgi:hypothetical protein
MTLPGLSSGGTSEALLKGFLLVHLGDISPEYQAPYTIPNDSVVVVLNSMNRLQCSFQLILLFRLISKHVPNLVLLTCPSVTVFWYHSRSNLSAQVPLNEQVSIMEACTRAVEERDME